MTELSLSNVDEHDFEEPDVGSFVIGHDWGTLGARQMVGHGSVTNDNCGTYRGRYGCLHTELHELPLMLDGKKWKGQVYHHPVFYSCHKPSCPVCFRSWAFREAGEIDTRLAEASKRFGLVEHIIASVPLSSYGLSDEGLRAKTVKALAVRGIVGGCLIFHGFRYKETRGWYWSPHFHVLGFIKGGYKCRSCVKQLCSSCCGFEAHTRRCFEKDGFIVKIAEDRYGVKGVRGSVSETAKYQLSHASIRTDVKRPHAVFWYGVCSYRKLKVKVEKRKASCPCCGRELIRLRYFGMKRFVLDRDSPYFVYESFDDLEEEGRVVWEEVPSSRYDYGRSGSYEN